ncbi:unconventional myosin-Va-like [Coccinella septempunctata]|uniref:unconventional myosin-Va-like n=1 Tax=Coccinella septempunctata TaxID=41139 RepID=UPI001D084286|nr:unconventional myosin-Va-like [Coccinella septempunctata]
MASVYYLLDDAKDIADYIIWSTEAKFELDKKRYFAALIIQRTFRGFAVRCEYKKMIRAATTIQKYVRGHLLRLHLHEIAAKAFRRKCMSTFNRLATRIQAAWRGYWVRKNFNIETIIAERKEELETQEAIAELFGKIFKPTADISDLSLQIGDMEEEEQIAYKIAKKSPEILRVLFDKHHLLRTRQIEGVLSVHGSKQLSLLETFLKRLECKEYMRKVRKLYKEVNTPAFEYMFKDAQARKIEDMMREKNHREGVEKAESINKKMPRSIHDKPFLVTKKIDQEPYEKRMLSDEEYKGLPLPVFREREAGEGVPRFRLDVHHVTPNPKDEPPYFIDHWKKVCCNHNFIYDFMGDKKG